MCAVQSGPRKQKGEVRLSSIVQVEKVEDEREFPTRTNVAFQVFAVLTVYFSENFYFVFMCIAHLTFYWHKLFKFRLTGWLPNEISSMWVVYYALEAIEINQFSKHCTIIAFE